MEGSDVTIEVNDVIVAVLVTSQWRGHSSSGCDIIVEGNDVTVEVNDIKVAVLVASQ